MNVLINWCWCSDSNRGGHYDCRVIVSIDRIAEDKSYSDPPMLDWVNLIEKHTLNTGSLGGTYTNRLKPEVLAWLNENVADQKWAVGTDAYNSIDTLSYKVFFQSYRDAQKFIKRWSEFGKPVNYFNYFRDIRRKLDTKSMTLKKVQG